MNTNNSDNNNSNNDNNSNNLNNLTNSINLNNSNELSESQNSETLQKLRKGGKIQLPLWLAKKLQEQGYVKIIVNKEFNKDYSRQQVGLILRKLENNETIGMKNRHYYFEVGSQLAERTGDATLAKSIRRALLLRYRQIYDQAMDTTGNTNNMVNGLTFSERDLFQCISETNQAATKVRTMENENVNMSSYHDVIHKK